MRILKGKPIDDAINLAEHRLNDHPRVSYRIIDWVLKKV